MKEQPEALRRADLLDERERDPLDFLPTKAAAGLRRLHAEHLEDERVIAVWRGRTLRAEQQRDELLGALKEMLEVWEEDPAYGAAHAEKARAAIARAEGEGK